MNFLAVVIIEFVLYNGNLDSLSLVRYSVEDLASGLFFTEEFYDPVRINFFTGNAQIGVEAAFIVIWLGLLLNEFRQMTNGWKIYIRQGITTKLTIPVTNGTLLTFAYTDYLSFSMVSELPDMSRMFS